MRWSVLLSALLPVLLSILLVMTLPVLLVNRMWLVLPQERWPNPRLCRCGAPPFQPWVRALT
jgi:hypothetical protein